MRAVFALVGVGYFMVLVTDPVTPWAMIPIVAAVPFIIKEISE